MLAMYNRRLMRAREQGPKVILPWSPQPWRLYQHNDDDTIASICAGIAFTNLAHKYFHCNDLPHRLSDL